MLYHYGHRAGADPNPAQLGSDNPMPNCFALTPTGADSPMPLAQIDDMICAHFGIQPDPKQYHMWWYDIIGFELAIGKTFSDIADYLWSRYWRDCSDENRQSMTRLIGINAYLAGHFVADAWVEIGRRH